MKKLIALSISLIMLIGLIGVVPFAAAAGLYDAEAATITIQQHSLKACSANSRTEPILVLEVVPSGLGLVHGMSNIIRYDNTIFDMVSATYSTSTIATVSYVADGNFVSGFAGMLWTGRLNASAGMGGANVNKATSGTTTEVIVAVQNSDGGDFTANDGTAAYNLLLRFKAGKSVSDLNEDSIKFESFDNSTAIATWSDMVSSNIILSIGLKEDPDGTPDSGDEYYVNDPYQVGKNASNMNPDMVEFPVPLTITYDNSDVPAPGEETYSGTVSSPADPADLAYGYAAGNDISYTFTNTGDAITGANIDLGNTADFEVSPATIDAAATNGTANFTVKLKAGKPVGSYTTTVDVKVNGTSVLTATDSVTQAVVKANQVAVSVSEVSKTYTSVTVSASGGNTGDYVYSKDNINWQASGLFEGLNANTAYTFYAKANGNASYHESAVASIGITTLADPRPIPTVSIDGYKGNIANLDSVPFKFGPEGGPYQDIYLTNGTWSTTLSEGTSGTYRIYTTTSVPGYIIHSGTATISGGGAVSIEIPMFAGELNGDHKINVFDIAVLIKDFGKTGSFVADFDGLGSVNATDISFIIPNIGIYDELK